MEFQLEKNVSLSPLTTLKVGGVAEYFATVRTVDELRAAWRFAQQTGQPPFVLGGGSNVLIVDGRLKRFVIKLELKGINFASTANKEVLVTAAAGEGWDGLVKETVEKGLSGLENLSGIPGTVGAAPVQNINAYGMNVGSVIVSVEVFDGQTGLVSTLSGEECAFAYRDSIFKHDDGASLVVVAVTFKLAPPTAANLSYRSASQSIEKILRAQNITQPTPADTRQAILQVRKNIGMLAGQYRSAGSFFKNVIVTKEKFVDILATVERDFAELDKQLSPWHWPLPDGSEKISTAFLMECSPFNKRTYGTKRWRGLVGISPLHSLSIVTEPEAKAQDVKNFVAEIISAVKNIFAVTLETEVDYIE